MEMVINAADSNRYHNIALVAEARKKKEGAVPPLNGKHRC